MGNLLVRGGVSTVVVVAAIGAVGVVAGGTGSPPMEWDRLPVLGEPFTLGRGGIEAAVDETQDRIASAAAACASDRGVKAGDVRGEVLESTIVHNIESRPGSVADAEQNGFRLVEAYEEAPSPGPSPGPSDGDLDPVVGTCISEVVRELSEHGTLTPAEGAPGVAELIASYTDEVLDVARIAEAREAWAKCVADRGVAAESLAEAVASVLPSITAALGSDPSPAGESTTALNQAFEVERAVAVAVAECDREAYAPVQDLWAELESNWLEVHGSAYEALEPQIRLQWAAAVGL